MRDSKLQFSAIISVDQKRSAIRGASEGYSVKNKITVGLALAAALLCGDAAAQTSAQTLSSPLAGYYKSDGQTFGGSVGNNHTTGVFVRGRFRGYFIYSIPAGEPITSATLSVNTASVLSGPNTLEVYDVTTNPATVAGMTTNVAIYNDLGTGVLYGTAVATTGNQTLTVTLNAAAIAAINAARGGSFAIGFLNATDNSGGDDTIFLGSIDTTPRDLVLSRAAPAPVPTMSEWAMILLGTILAGGAALYIQRQQRAI